MISTYKCLNCGGSLIFQPEKQNLKCEYCLSEFLEEEINAKEKEYTAKTAQEEADVTSENDGTVSYSCPSCGAAIVASETEIVSKCYYCHNEVLRDESTAEKFQPDVLIPFTISKEKAKEEFLNWASKKKFVPKGYFNKRQIENLTGVYFPYWISDYESKGDVRFDCTKLRVWRSGDTEYTETSKFKVDRKGDLKFRNIISNALSKAENRIAESVLPYNFDEMMPYSKPYLLGFQAESRDIEKEDIEESVKDDVQQYSLSMLQRTVVGYDSVRASNVDIAVKNVGWKYSLFPVWVLTYKGRNGKIFSFSMNGQTGKTCGELPISYKRLSVLFVGVMAAVFAVVSLVEYFLC